MDSVLTSWAFGFGGWIGVFGSTFLFLNVPHNHTLLLMLLSPWLGGVGLYLLMYATHAWINVSVQVARAMTKYEIIMAVLTSFIGVLIVAIARLIIDMERGHRTPAQAAAEESAAATATSEGADSDTEDAGATADDEGSSPTHSSESSNANSESDEENTDDDEDESDDENTGDEADESDAEAEYDAEEKEDEAGDLNKAVIEDSSTSSYENINTPRLTTLSGKDTSPIPKIPDI